MHNCDVHILKHPLYSRDEYFAECLESLKDEPINLHIIDGIPNHIGQGRYNGFTLGDSDYVSFVDDDDYIVPGIFEKCIAELDNSDVDAVTTNYRVIMPDGVINNRLIKNEKTILKPNDLRSLHQLIVFRRTSIEPYLHILTECADFAELCLLANMFLDDRQICNIAEFGYYWRKTAQNAKSLNIPKNMKYIDQLNQAIRKKVTA